MVGELTWRRRLLGLWVPLVGFCVVALFPFTWMAATSLKTNAELYDPKATPLQRWRSRAGWSSISCWSS